ncbi:MAG: uroporphyrinogen decarboxylase, partial [Acetobacteraceae bacterium]|nr:uroporphyrinogen decarboxylase [Acetobacteraceae bacterium]
LGLDTTADPGVITPLLSSEMPLQGNLDPMALLVGERALAQEVAAVLAAFSGRPHVFNLGHGVLPETPPQHVAELVRLVRSATLPS